MNFDELRHCYEREGYVLVRGLLPRGDVLALRERAESLVSSATVGNAPQSRWMQTAYDASGSVRLVKASNMVDIDPAFDALASRSELVDVVEALVGNGARRFRDVLVIKPARTGGTFSYHQDSAYWDVDPPALVSCWVGLGDVPAEQSCLAVVPGTHRKLAPHGLFLRSRYRVPGLVTRALRGLVTLAGTGDRPGKSGGSLLLWQLKRAVLTGATRYAPILFDLQDFRLAPDAVSLDREVQLPVQAGDVIFFHSLLWHASGPNRSETTRYAEILSYMSATARFVGRGRTDFAAARSPS